MYGWVGVGGWVCACVWGGSAPPGVLSECQTCACGPGEWPGAAPQAGPPNLPSSLPFPQDGRYPAVAALDPGAPGSFLLTGAAGADTAHGLVLVGDLEPPQPSDAAALAPGAQQRLEVQGQQALVGLGDARRLLRASGPGSEP